MRTKLIALAGALLLVAACESTPEDTGGTTGTGGSPASGGSPGAGGRNRPLLGGPAHGQKDQSHLYHRSALA